MFFECNDQYLLRSLYPAHTVLFFEIWLNRNIKERCNSDKQLTWLNEPCCEVRKDVGEMARLSLTIGNFCHPKPGHQFFKSQMEWVGHGFFPGAISCGRYQSIMGCFEIFPLSSLEYIYQEGFFTFIRNLVHFFSCNHLLFTNNLCKNWIR